MSYFDDNQDRIIYGPRPSELLRQATPRAYYNKKDGTRQFIDEMSDSHLRNALALAERKGNKLACKYLKEEIEKRKYKQETNNINIIT